MAKQINTVLGPVKAKDLGKTLMHEHLIYGSCGFVFHSVFTITSYKSNWQGPHQG